MWKSIRVPEKQYNQITQIQEKLQETSVGTVHIYTTINHLIYASSMLIGGTV